MGRTDRTVLMKHRVRSNIVYFFVRLLNLFILLMPLRPGLFIGSSLGTLAYLILNAARERTIENLQIAFGRERSPREIRAIARRVFQNLGKNAVELFSFPKFTKRNIEQWVSVSGWDRIDKALEQGRGMVGVTAHLGNWELLAAYFGLKGYNPTVIAREVRNQYLDKMLCSLRSSKGVNIIDRSEPPRRVLEALKRNSIVGILPDQDVDSIDGVFVDFFGRPAYTPTGPVTLALACKLPIIPCYIVRENSGHKIIIEEPLEMFVTGDKQKDLLVNTQRWSKVTESYIRRFPAQWVWMHQRWKTRPEGAVLA